MTRPKFMRRDVKAMEGLMTRSWGMATGRIMNYGTFEDAEEKNFGTDISTLAERLEAGEL
jgi:hypothetical protein